MNERERTIFEDLCRKHNYTLESMPGLFFTEITRASLTPRMLIHLWLYDRLIYKKSFKKSKLGYPTLGAADCLMAIYDLKRQGGYRGDKEYSYEKVKDIANKVIKDWEKMSLISRLRSNFYFQINCDILLPHRTRNESVLVQWYTICPYEYPTPDKVKSAAMEYRSNYKLFKEKSGIYGENRK